MLPILVDLKTVPVALAGNGEVALGRLGQLDREKATVTVYSPDPADALAKAAGDRLVPRLPTTQEIESVRLLFISGLRKSYVGRLVNAARSKGVLVNTEDETSLSDFHMPAIVRRGALTLTVSTGGASPALARILKRRLEAQYGESWSARLDEVAKWRRTWRADGLTGAEITARTEAALSERGWLL